MSIAPVAGRIDERNDDSANVLGDTPPPENQALVWPPPTLDGAIVWFVNERACISEIPDRCQIDAPLTVDVNVFQSAGDVWGLGPTPDDIVIEREESVGGFAFDTPPRQRSRWNYRPWMIAAAALGIVIALGGRWARDEKPVGLQSIAIADLVEPTDPAPNNGVIIRPGGPSLATVGTPTESIPTASPARPAGDAIAAATSRSAELPVASRQPDHIREAAVSESLQRPVEAMASPPSVPAASSPSLSEEAPPSVNATPPTVGLSTPLASISAPVLAVEPSSRSGPSGSATTVLSPKPEMEDLVLVNQTIQRYRVAYDDLDAWSAQAIWPSVDQVALARAFAALESQTLSFDTCDVQVQTKETATATCQGSARYVPKIGNRDPHVESRVWSFNLRKQGAGWMIDRARVAR